MITNNFTIPRQQHSKSDLALELSNVSVTLGNRRVLDDLSFTLKKAEVGCLLGASGCGKTTALRAIAGFVHPDAGMVILDGRTLSANGVWAAPEKRRIGVVFQDYALFPHLTVQQNIAFGLKGQPSEVAHQRVRDMLELTGLKSQASQYPHQLSGGQQQRTALARALAPSPNLVLLDEPFSNLDPDLRERLAMDLRDLLKAAATTALLVTHDQYEAFALADAVGVMENGAIAQWDSAYSLYHRPQSKSVADFVGQGAFLPAQLQADRVDLEIGSLMLANTEEKQRAQENAKDGRLSILLRPDDITHDDASPLTAVVTRKAFRGAQFLYTLELASGHQVFALVPSHHNHAIGEAIGIRLDADHVVSFKPNDFIEARA